MPLGVARRRHPRAGAPSLKARTFEGSVPADAARWFETAPEHELAPAQRLAAPAERRRLAVTAPAALRVRWRRRALVEPAEAGPVVALAERRAEVPSVKRRGRLRARVLKLIRSPQIYRGFIFFGYFLHCKITTF